MKEPRRSIDEEFDELEQMIAEKKISGERERIEKECSFETNFNVPSSSFYPRDSHKMDVAKKRKLTEGDRDKQRVSCDL